ncbi:MAG: response regulator transcription factor [Bermanella sp.]
MLALLLEDEVSLAQLVVEYLQDENIECDHAANGRQALQLIKGQTFDVLILDINMPGLNGLQVCEQVRQLGINTPIIMLTARGDLQDKLKGFGLGADDYLVKPFAMEELVARIQALAQRRQRSNIICISDLNLNLDEKSARRNQFNVQLSPDEWRLIIVLARNSPAVVNRVTLEDEIWPEGVPSKDAFKMLVYRLRKTLNIDGLPPLLQTIRGVGLALRES